MLIRVGCLCRFWFLLLVIKMKAVADGLRERANFFLLPFPFNYMVTIMRGFIFIFVLGIRGFILLWHSLGLTYYH